jgi:predicted ArsR family transcriptional regulator
MRAELVGASRAKLLEVLRASAEPLSSYDLAAAAGLHVTTARFHLEILGQSGLIETHVQRHGRGRPRLLYRATTSDTISGEELSIIPSVTLGAPVLSGAPGAAEDQRLSDDVVSASPAYQDLAMLLAGHWDEASASGVNRAQQAGRHAAAHASFPFAALATPSNRRPATTDPDTTEPDTTEPDTTEPDTTEPEMTVARAAEVISEGFAERGFSPEVVQEGPASVIRLRSCPFLAVARVHPEVVCALHLGLLQGSWERLGAPAVHASLHPFSRPGMCLARLTPLPGAAARTQTTLAPSAPDNQRSPNRGR